MALNSPIRSKPEIFKLGYDRAACIRCGSGSLLPTAEKEARRCDNCGSTVSLDELAGHHGEWLNATAHQRGEHFRRSARIFVLFALVSLLITVPWGVYAESPGMMVVAAFITVLSAVGWFSMRYRAWQAATGRYYEAEAPFGDFMRDELRGLTGGRG